MSEINDLIKKIRGNDSLRKATEKTGISYTYWSILEKGVDPRSHAPVKPTPDTLRAISKGYNFPYEELMRVAGYIDENKEESEYALSEDQFAIIVKEIEDQYKIDLHGNPIAHDAVRQALDLIARTIKSKK